MSNVDKAAEMLDGLDKPSLGQIAERLSALFGGHAFAKVAHQPPGDPAPVVSEQTEFDVLLTDNGPKKIDVIKAVREVTGLGLKEAKDFVEKTTERCLKSGVDRATADLLKSKMAAAGATVVLR